MVVHLPGNPAGQGRCFSPLHREVKSCDQSDTARGAELGLEPNLFDSSTENLSVDQRDR